MELNTEQESFPCKSGEVSAALTIGSSWGRLEKVYTHVCPYPCHTAVLPPCTVEAFKLYLESVTAVRILTTPIRVVNEKARFFRRGWQSKTDG